VAQMPAPKNNGTSGLFDLNYPPSPAPSSSASETSETSDMFDTEHLSLSDEYEDVTEDTVPTVTPPQPTTVEHLVNALLSAWPHCQPQEMTLLIYLHHNAATLTDVDALIPALNDNIPVMSKLADNIGYFYTPSSTPTNPSRELEAILGHILAQSDAMYQTYEMTNMHLRYYNNQLCQVEPQRRRRVHNEDKERKQYLKTLKREAEQRRKGLPVPKAQIQLRALQVVLPSLTSPQAPTGLAKGEDFSRTRLHNGPGLMDRKRPMVRLSQVDTRSTVATPAGISVGKHKSAESDHVWADTKSNPEFLFGKKDAIVFSFPSKP
jgi:hypothetical protein